MTTIAAPSAASPQTIIQMPPTDSLTAATVQQNANEIAKEILRKLEEFSGEMLCADKTRDPALDVAFNEIRPAVLQKKKSLTNADAIALFKHFVALRTLNLSGFYRINHDMLPHMVHLKMLVTLNLSGTGVTSLKSLIDYPLENLRSVNFFQTKISREDFLEFLNKHDKISDLTPPENPPEGFFARFRSDILESVKIIIASKGKGILQLDDIKDFFTQAPKLINLCLTIDAETDFSTKDWVPPKTRKINLTSRNMTVDCELKGMDKDSRASFLIS